MQQFKISQSEARRNGFMKDLRNVQREEIKKRARSELIKHLTEESLNQLIEETQNHISNRSLGELIKYANQHYHKAVGHIGNLVIDGVIDISQLQRFTLVPDYNPNWLWLVEILVERSYCTIGLFQHCIKTIAPSKHEKSVQHALSILYKITASNLHSSFLLREENVLLAILNATLRPDNSSKTAYLLIYELIRKEESLGNRFDEGILRERMITSIKNGLASSSLIVQKNCCKILKELAEKKIFFNEQLDHQIYRLVRNQNFTEFGDIVLDYLTIFVHSQREKIMNLIDMGLLVELGKWKELFEQEQRPQTGKIIQLCRQIKDHTEGLGLITKGIHQQLDRLDLITFKCTVSF